MLADLRTAGGIGDGEASGENDRLAEMPEVRAKISEMMAAHWEHWVDQPLPILGNRTPMEAVKDADGREVVESLVIQGERFGGQQATVLQFEPKTVVETEAQQRAAFAG